MKVYEIIRELSKFDPYMEIDAEINGYFKGTDDDNGNEITAFLLYQKAPINNVREEDNKIILQVRKIFRSEKE